MAYSATLANERKLLSDEEHRRLLNLFSRAGLSMDHELFDEDMLDKATKAILKTRDGLLRAAVPNPIGTCVFLNDVSADEMNKALRRHKELMKDYPRQGAGIDAFVDASDTGYTENGTVEDAMKGSKKVMNGLSNGKVNGTAGGKPTNNGVPQQLQDGLAANGYANGHKN
ncbi:hypothetical protein J1614_011734 [Plenodomus biglobosus]|nr:hypothetical protein J1614_011734 [Plenodomus biglobosus]